MTLQKRINAFVRKIAAMEGKGSEVSVGNIREVLKCLSLLDAAEAYMVTTKEADDCECSEKVHVDMASKVGTEFSTLMREYRVTHLQKMMKKFHAKKAKSR